MNYKRNKPLSSLDQKYNADIISLMPGHVYWKDKDGIFLGCNIQQAREAGFNSPEDVVGKTDKDMPWAIQADYLREIDHKVMESGQPLTLEELFELPDGTKKTYLSKKIPLYDEQQQVSGVLGVSFDITERKNLEQALVEAKELAEDANRVKTEFLENMRHDLRTPLTGIVGFAEIIKNESTDPKIKEYADNLMTASHMLLEFLNEILDAIKVLTGDMPTVKRKFSLATITDKIITLLRPRAIAKNLKINFQYDSKIPNYMIGDPSRIQHILLELISNALNFTDQGQVTVIITLAKKQAKKLVIKCTIQDTGIGIPADKQEEIFLRFKKLSPSYKGIYQSAGLGLTIVKQFIDEMDGEIYCQSVVGEGSIFTCLIPLQESLLDDSSGIVELDDIQYHDKKIAVAISEEVPQEAQIQFQTHILIVEDQPLAAKVARLVVERLNCAVDVAETGNDALRYVADKHYDLIFMDVGLPDISGLDVTKRIRAQEWKLNQHIPIIALTAHVEEGGEVANVIELLVAGDIFTPADKNTIDNTQKLR